ncbi:MAG: protein kinase [Polyangiales bacterium]
MSTIDEEAPESPPPIGSVLEDRYRLVGELGAGGIGWVFRAEHRKLRHHVALKMLQARFVANDVLRARFEREAKALAALSHPHIVTLTDYSIVDGHPYLVMELLEGRTLGELLAEGPLPEARARRIARQVLEALAYAHQRGFVHRDLKPDNIFLVPLPSEPDFVKILDFGFVKLFDPEVGHSIGGDLTRSGIGFGTPSYMSPEQASGDRTGPPTDVYALGITFFEMLAGRRPFVGEVPEILRQQISAPLPPLVVGDLVAVPELRELLERSTAKAASERFASAVEMLDALDRLPEPALVPARDGARRAGRERSPRPVPETAVSSATSLVVRRLLAGVAALALAALVVFALRGRESETPPELAPPAIAASTVTAPPVAASPPVAEPVPSTESPDPASPTSPDATAASESPSDADAAGDDGLGESPWTSRPRVAVLATANRQIAEGRILTGSTEEAIERYGRGHRDDPRPYLLLGSNAFRQGQESVSLARYELAQRTAADARNDPRMLRHLVRLAAEGRVTSRAARAIERIYGPLAKGAIERELARAELDAGASARLRRLAERLGG